MESLLYVALWGGLIFLMMRFGCGAHVMGHGHGKKSESDGATGAGDQELRWVAPKKAVDPVCRKSVATESAKPSVFDGNVYYFCSRECREVFEAAPDVYLGGEQRDATRQLEHSNV
jgi:YHS domain-containing protein